MGLFRRKDACAVLVSNEKTVVQGVSWSEYNQMRNELKDLYQQGKSRQKSADAKPSAYMMGIQDALDILDKYPPHEL